MKKRKIVLMIAMVLIVAIFAAGCMGNSNAVFMSRLNSLEDQIDSLWQEIYDLQDEIYYRQWGETEFSEDPAEPSLDPLPTPSAGLPAGEDYTSAVAALGTEVQALIDKAEQVAVPGTYEESLTVYFEIKPEFKTLEYEIDALDSQLELDYMSGAVTQEDYRTYERQLGQMDDQLDAAKDQLEIRLGIGD